MRQKEKVILSWSGGKDSSLALYEIQQKDEYEVVSLLTTVSEHYQRISHHGVRVKLLEQQASAIGIDLHILYLPQTCTNDIYERQMKKVMLEYLDKGIRTVAFGDIFLEDLRTYREEKLSLVDMKAIFPIWKRDTTKLVNTFIDLGFKSYISCIDAEKLDPSFAGRLIDESFLHDLPDGVDPCGENGEFHSFVFDGPIFNRHVPVSVGEIVQRDKRYFADLLSDPQHPEPQAELIPTSREPARTNNRSRT